jgi:hypothetical protein
MVAREDVLFQVSDGRRLATKGWRRSDAEALIDTWPRAHPPPVEVKPGETTHLKAGRLNIENKLGAMYVIVRDRQGQEVLETSSFRIALPPGSYMLEIDSKKFFKSLTDEQRRIPIDIAAGEEVSVPVR